MNLTQFGSMISPQRLIDHKRRAARDKIEEANEIREAMGNYPPKSKPYRRLKKRVQRLRREALNLNSEADALQKLHDDDELEESSLIVINQIY